MPYLVASWIDAGTLGRQPRLGGGPVSLRPFAATDAPALVTAYADPGIQRWHCRTLDEAEAVEQVQNWNLMWDDGTGASWAVTDASGAVVGRMGLREMSPDAGTAEVAYWTMPAARGRRVAPTALKVLCDWAFGVAGFHRLELRHAVGNTASCRVAAAGGFTTEGTLLSSVLHADGWHDMHLHALTAVTR